MHTSVDYLILIIKKTIIKRFLKEQAAYKKRKGWEPVMSAGFLRES